MFKVIILMGLQASGKTSFCKEAFPELKHISLDTCKTRTKEENLLRSAMLDRQSCVIDNTNPTVADRARYIRHAKAFGAKIEGYFLESRVADCVRRNEARCDAKRVPRLAIAGTSNKLQLPSYAEGFDDLTFVRITETGFETSPWRTS